MKPEAKEYLDRAKEDLDDARKIMAAVSLAKIAARSAYYAPYHAAEALIIERRVNLNKRH